MRTGRGLLQAGGWSRAASLLLAVMLHLPAATFVLQKPDSGERKAEKAAERASIYLPRIPEIIDRGSGGDITCMDWYVGIGVEVRFDGRIIRVARGYPAERAGLRVGDEIDPRFPVEGGVAYVALTRDGASSIMRIPVEKICVS